MSHYSPNLRRAVGLLAAPALAASVIAALPAAPARAASSYDPNPVLHGSSWLSGQLTDGLIVNPNFGGFTDYGLTVDAGLGLAAVGDTASVGTISSALAPKVAQYYSYEAAPGKTHVSAGSLAKAAAFAEAAGEDPTSYGGQDLIDRLGDRVSTDAASAGRIGDVFFPDVKFDDDFSNTIGQAFAVAALDDQGSALTESATDYLLGQQCDAGYFRLTLGATAADSCNAAGNPAASTDVTALAIIELQSQEDNARVQAAISSATTWLKSTQGADGSFGNDAPTTAPNANSTGLAGWALGIEGETDAASNAAVWLRNRQADDLRPCTTGLSFDEGALAYDDAALKTAREDGIEDATSDQFRRSTAQALPALQWAPAGTYASSPTRTTGFVRAGSKQRISADDLAPGQTVCFARGPSQAFTNADASGHADGKVRLPRGTADRVYRVHLTDRLLGKVTFRALDAKKLSVTTKKSRMRQGGRQFVTVTGLQAGEPARVKFQGKIVGTGTAGRKGRVFVSFRTSKSVQAKSVRVVAKGRFGIRSGTDRFTITKR